MAIEIETRHPDNIRKEWGRIVVEDILEDSSLMFKYERLLKFFSKEKELESGS